MEWIHEAGKTEDALTDTRRKRCLETVEGRLQTVSPE